MKSRNLLTLSIGLILVVATEIQASPLSIIPAPKPVTPKVEIKNGKFGPITSPTFPDKPSVQPKLFTPKYDKADHPRYLDVTTPMPKDMYLTNSKITVKDIAQSNATQMILKDKNGKIYYFSQFKNLDGSYRVVIPKKFFDEIAQLGFNLNEPNIEAATDEEYLSLLKDVDLVVYGEEPTVHIKYMGGEGGRCAAGTIGGAIAGGAAGAAGGPVGIAIGAIGGGLVGSAASCR